MTQAGASVRKHSTLVLCTVLHALTHAYQVVLVPLYLLMVADLHLSGVKSAALIVSICNAVYFLLSYPAGILADRFNRKTLLGVGLIGNAAAMVLLGTTHQYWLLLLLAMLAGVFGSLFHPAANALVPAHYPKSMGMAVGLMGMGSGAGFFLGSQYAGWRAETVSNPWWGLASWQVPCIELGLLGIVVGFLFMLLASEAAHAASHAKAQPLGPGMRRRVLAIAFLAGCRDFAGVATISLVSIYLQKAHDYNTQQVGWIIGAMGLIGVVGTPLFVWLTSGKKRLPGFALIVIAAGLVQLFVPYVSTRWILLVLAIFQVFHLSSYSVSEVAMVELVGPALRGRVIGLYLTVCGTLGAVSPWVMGLWTDLLGQRAYRQGGYVIPFTVLGLLMMAAALSVRLMAKLGQARQQSTPDAIVTAATEPAV
ncbi:MAG TPA: MFS transporter [Tepidisphaeraceae bacterium]|nr:MFS transporter [Tepidisphaeraceae bacterium]